VAFFAVLRNESDSQDQPFTVLQCHINLWSLAAMWPRRRIFLLDVGLKIRADSEALDGFHLALPAKISSYKSLAREMTSDRQIAELIFDSPVQFGSVPGPNEMKTIQVGDDEAMPVLPVVPKETKDTALSQDGFDVWPVKLARPLAPGETGYLRIRYNVADLGQTWQWQKLGFRKTGAILDFRLSDQRSTATLESGDAIRHRVMPLETVNFFSMMPARLHGRSVSPDARYTRALENDAWSAYLHRKPERTGRTMLATAWKASPRDEEVGGVKSNRAAVTTERPLRIFVDYVQRRSPHPVVIAGLTLLTSLIAAGAVFDLPLKGWSQAIVDVICDFAILLASLGTGISLATVITFATKNVAGLKWLFNTAQKIVRKLDGQRFAHRSESNDE
jgi:hypothetical protein